MLPVVSVELFEEILTTVVLSAGLSTGFEVAGNNLKVAGE